MCLSTFIHHPQSSHVWQHVTCSTNLNNTLVISWSSCTRTALFITKQIFVIFSIFLHQVYLHVQYTWETKHLFESQTDYKLSMPCFSYYIYICYNRKNNWGGTGKIYNQITTGKVYFLGFKYTNYAMFITICGQFHLSGYCLLYPVCVFCLVRVLRWNQDCCLCDLHPRWIRNGNGVSQTHFVAYVIKLLVLNLRICPQLLITLETSYNFPNILSPSLVTRFAYF